MFDEEAMTLFQLAAKPAPKPIDVAQLVGIPGLPDDAQPSDIQTYLAQQRGTIEYGTLYKVVPVVFFGEGHSNISAKNELIENITTLKKAGLTHLAMEMFPKALQVEIDRYYLSVKNRETLLRHLQEHWNHGEGTPEKYLAIVDAAKIEGIKVIGIDNTSVEQGQAGIVEQNREWAKTIASIIAKQQGAKLAVYGGLGHIVYSPFVSSVNQELLKTYHIPSISVAYGCGSSPSLPLEHASTLGDRIDAIAPSLGLENEKFALPIKNNTFGVRRADLYIHLPKT